MNLPDDDVHDQAVSYEPHHADDHVDHHYSDFDAPREEAVSLVEGAEVVLEQRLVVQTEVSGVSNAAGVIWELHELPKAKQQKRQHVNKRAHCKLCNMRTRMRGNRLFEVSYRG